MTLTTRPWRDETDYQQMRQLLFTGYAQARPTAYATVGELDWWRCTDNPIAPESRCQLWFTAESALAGFAWLARNQVDLVTAHPYQALEPQILAWAEEQTRSPQQEHQPARLTAWSFRGDTQREAMLQERGYQRSGYQLSYRWRPLAQSEPEETAPAGYLIRELAGEQELAQLVGAHQQAFGSTRITAANYQAVLQAPTYRRDLHLVAIDTNGTICAFALFWFDQVNRIGLLEPLGTVPVARRRGLARALLTAGASRLSKLNAQGIRVISADTGSPEGQLYGSFGFKTIAQNEAWTKQLIS